VLTCVTRVAAEVAPDHGPTGPSICQAAKQARSRFHARIADRRRPHSLGSVGSLNQVRGCRQHVATIAEAESSRWGTEPEEREGRAGAFFFLACHPSRLLLSRTCTLVHCHSLPHDKNAGCDSIDVRSTSPEHRGQCALWPPPLLVCEPSHAGSLLHVSIISQACARARADESGDRRSALRKCTGCQFNQIPARSADHLVHYPCKTCEKNTIGCLLALPEAPHNGQSICG
jgi:hypothetical protein